MLDRLNETIVAISSAPGRGAVGILRLSGAKSFPIAEQLGQCRNANQLSNHRGFTRVEGEVLVDESLSIPASFYLFRAPRSYTRQDLVEVHTIGSPAILDMVRKRAMALGALPAEPGEFTARAFFGGGMGLAAAEGVAGVIRARTDAQLRAARRLMDGALAERVRTARDALAELLALVEADIDFAEEPIDFISPTKLNERVSAIDEGLASLLKTPDTLERLDALPRVLLFGAPNAGKSTLMNRLSGTDRAICAAVAGTTRDILSAPVRIGGGEAVVLDAAGVDESGDGVIATARRLVLSEAGRVDLICVVIDASAIDFDRSMATARSLEAGRFLVVLNKCDLLKGVQAGEPAPESGAIDARIRKVAHENLGPVCIVSALSGEGLDDLKRMMADALALEGGTSGAELLVLSERQQQAIQAASASLRRAVELAREADATIDCADLLAFELRDALDALGAVMGEVTTEDLLGQVFARFCIGK